MATRDRSLDFLRLGVLPESDPPPGFDAAVFAPRGNAEIALPLHSLALDVSGNCNLACRYCAEAASLPPRPPMAPEMVEAALRYLVRTAPPSVRPSVRLGSGEPLLALPQLRVLREFLAPVADRVDVFVTTNGTLIDEETADWLADTGWRIKISIDGPASIHDHWRRERGDRATYARVAAAVGHMQRRCPQRISAAAVLCREADPERVMTAIAALGVRRIELLPVAVRHESDDFRPTARDVRKYVDFIEAYADDVAEHGLGDRPIMSRFEESVRNAMGFGNSAVPCGAGRSYVCAGPDGRLYPCFRFVGVDRYCLGDIEHGIDPDAATAFRRGVGRPAHHRRRCRTCWGRSFCGGPCFAVAAFFGDEECAPDDLHCLYRLADARAALCLVERLHHGDREKLLPFLPIHLDLS